MSNALRAFRRHAAAAKPSVALREQNHRHTARDLARRAMQNHSRGIEFARDTLREALGEGDASARKILSVHLRAMPAPDGTAMHTVSLAERLDDGGERYHSEIVVATRQDAIAATDRAMATPVSFTTRVASIVEEDDGSRFLAVILEETAHVAVQHT